MICYIHYMISKDEGKNSSFIFSEIYQRIKEANLLENLSTIKVLTCGNEKDLKTNFRSFEKVEHVKHNSNLLEFEFPTLQLIYEDAKKSEKNFQILYLHLKGSSKIPLDKLDSSWRKEMLNCVVDNHTVCLSRLNDHIAVGTKKSDPVINGIRMRHFSGNFWWANSEYIKSLPNPEKNIISETHKSWVKGRRNKNPFSPVKCANRYLAELWIGMNDLDDESRMFWM